MFTFIHAADIHLDSPLRGLESHEDAPVDEIRGATRRAFINLIDLAIEEAVDFLLIAGDLYDGDWKDYNTGLFFTRQMGRLDKAGIRAFIVSGNHDGASRITRNLPLPENVVHFSAAKPESFRLDELDVVIHAQSYASGTISENLAANYPLRISGSFNIGILHTALTGRPGHENYAPCSLDDLKSKGYDYWALGHVHKQEVVCKDPMVVFPGNIQGRHIKESGPKGAVLVRVEDGYIAEIEYRDLDVVRWVLCHVDLTTCETEEAVYEQVRKAMDSELNLGHFRLLAMRLVLTGSCPLHTELHNRLLHWTEAFRGIAAAIGEIWLEKVQLSTQRQIGLEEIVGTDTPFSELLQTIDRLDFKEVGLTELLPELARLKSKLPPELLHEDCILEGPPAKLEALKDEVKELLIGRLMHYGSKS